MSPNTKDELMDYCLRALGHPVVEVNIDDDQMEDRVDEALQWFREHHPEGSKRYYLKHLVTQSDIDNSYVNFGADADLLTVVRMLPVNTIQGQTNFFDIKYQMMLNDVTDLNNYAGDMAYYEQMQQHLSLLDMKLSGNAEITFDRQNNRVNFYLAKERLTVGSYIVFEVYGVRTPNSNNDYNSLWNHKFIKSYTTALIKRQWGVNLIKFDGMTLPGGVTINARQIYEDALQDIEKVMERFKEEEDLGPIFFIG
tara:strand:- start:12154 stop:12912 length:759 start_codon:yes stop_codon:yes gene_type:complete